MGESQKYSHNQPQYPSKLGKMTEKKSISARKLAYAEKLKGLLDEYDSFLIVSIANIGSKQINKMRKDLRGRARFLFGKNTLIRKIIREYVKQTGNKRYMKIMNAIKGNIGFVFTKEPVISLREEVQSIKKECAAKAGSTAPIDVYIFAGPTGIEPTQTFVFQAMDIPTRINKTQKK
eukprot:78414_1